MNIFPRALAIFGLIFLAACSSSTSPDTTNGDRPLPPVGTNDPSNPGEHPTADASGSKHVMPITQPSTGTTAHASNQPLNFLIVGDQGTAGVSLFGSVLGSAGGEEDTTQADLAQNMAKVCDNKASDSRFDKGCHFAIAAGDNFYDAGVPTYYDERFNVTFESIYGHLDIPFFLVLGNHDNGLSGDTVELGDNQVSYSNMDESDPNWGQVEDFYTGHFRMPARYYSHRWGETLELFGVDGDTIDTDIGHASAPTTSARYDNDFQRAWLKKAAEISPAKWKISFSHYNYISNGNYGTGPQSFRDAMEETLCDKVQFHIQGHEHDLRWLSPVEECGRTEFIVSGAGGRTESRPAAEVGYAERSGDDAGISDYRSSAAFMWASIDGNQITVEWYSEDLVSDTNPEPIETFVVTLEDLGFTHE